MTKPMTERMIDVPADIFTSMDEIIENLRYNILKWNSTKPAILVHINDFSPSSEDDKKHMSWSQNFETHSVKVEYNHNSNFSKRELLQRISKILLDLSNDECNLEQKNHIEKTCILKDLLKNYHYPYEKIIFKNDKKLFSKHLIIGYNIENELICDWDLTGEEHESIFREEEYSCGWCQTSDILNVKFAYWTFLHSNGRPKDPNEIAEELWNKIIDANSDIDLSNNCIVYDFLNDNENISNPISEIINKINKLKIKKMNISNNILSDEGLEVLINELVKHNELEELDISNNKISDIGLRCIKNLLQGVPNLKKIIMTENYGPSDETIKELISWASIENQYYYEEKLIY